MLLRLRPRLGIPILLAALLAVGGCSPDAASGALGRVVETFKGLVGAAEPAPEPGGKDGAGKDAGKRAHLVETTTVAREALQITSVYTGSLRSRRTVRIFNQEEGRVVSLPFYEGDPVAKGAVLLALDDALLRAELAKADARRREAQANVNRLKRLRASQMVAEEEYLRVATAVEVAKAEEDVLRTRLGYTRVSAPFAGVVAARLVEPGDIVSRYTHVLTLIDPDSLVTDLQASELLLPHLKVEDRVTVRIDALGDGEFAGRILRIHPEIDARTRQGRVEVELHPVPDGARSGQFARVTFSVSALAQRVIPFAALRRDRDGEFVFHVAEDGRVARVPVRSGRRLADRVEILEGPEPGSQVVTRGFLGLAGGMAVKPVGGGRKKPAADGAPAKAPSAS